MGCAMTILLEGAPAGARLNSPTSRWSTSPAREVQAFCAKERASLRRSGLSASCRLRVGVPSPPLTCAARRPELEKQVAEGSSARGVYLPQEIIAQILTLVRDGAKAASERRGDRLELELEPLRAGPARG